MKVNIYSLFDSKAAVYGTPFFMLNDGSAVRQVKKWVEDKGSMLGNYPEDYSLFLVGHFDDLIGGITATTPVCLHTCSSLVSHTVPFVNPLLGNLLKNGEVRQLELPGVDGSKEVR